MAKSGMSQGTGMSQILDAMKTTEDSGLAVLYNSFSPVKNCLAMQCLFVAHCFRSAQEFATTRTIERFTYTWQKRLQKFRSFPPGGTDTHLPLKSQAPPSFKVGILGCGCLGKTIVQMLLDAGFQPSQIVISSRSPHKLKHLQQAGVLCVFDNAQVASCVHVLLICCLPSQLPNVADKVKGSLSPSTLVVSLVVGVTPRKLQNLFGVDFVLQPDANAKAVVERMRPRAPAAYHVGKVMAEAAHRSSRAKAAVRPMSPSEIVELSSLSLVPDSDHVKRLMKAIEIACYGLDLPTEETHLVCLKALLGSKMASDTIQGMANRISPAVGEDDGSFHGGKKEASQVASESLENVEATVVSSIRKHLTSTMGEILQLDMAQTGEMTQTGEMANPTKVVNPVDSRDPTESSDK